jgi:hypothetical protein
LFCRQAMTVVGDRDRCLVASACYSLSEIRIPLLRIRIALVQFSFSVLQPVQARFQCFSAGSGSFALFCGCFTIISTGSSFFLQYFG